MLGNEAKLKTKFLFLFTETEENVRVWVRTSKKQMLVDHVIGANTISIKCLGADLTKIST